MLSTILFALLLAGCAGLIYTPAPTSMPVDYIPTLLALTQHAAEQARVTPSPVLAHTETLPPSPTPTPVPPTHTATHGPSPTALAYNPSATATLAPTSTPTPNLSPTSTALRRATRTPTITPTPTLPVAYIQIDEPGPMSRLTSPILLVVNLRTIPSGNYHVELLAEPLQPDGEARMLYREVRRLISNPVAWMYMEQEIQFELSRVSEFAQLRLGVFDQFGRPAWVRSLDLLLLSMGPNTITPGGLLTEPIVIREPTPNKLIQGGTVIVSGMALPTEDFLLVELVTFDGTIVGYRQVYVEPSPDGGYVPYTVEVPYQVTTATWVRLRIFESGSRIPGIQNLSSVEVLLSP